MTSRWQNPHKSRRAQVTQIKENKTNVRYILTNGFNRHRNVLILMMIGIFMFKVREKENDRLQKISTKALNNRLMFFLSV